MVKEIKPDELYTTQEAREFLRVSERTIKRFLKNGIISAHKVGGRYRIWGREILLLVSPEAEVGATRLYRRFKEKAKKKIQDW